MVNAQHTPGPWLIAGCSVYALVEHKGYQVNRFFLNVMSSRQAHEATEAECLANARLIAASPRLLKACQQALYALKGREHDEFLREAIAEATGAAP